MATLKDFINHPEDQTKEEWADYLKLINTVYDFKSSIQGYNVEIRSYNSTSQISKRFYEEHVIMASVLDSFNSKNEINFKELNEHIFNYIPKTFLHDIPVKSIQNIILKMIRFGFIIPKKTENIDLPLFEITEIGISALQQQTFQSLAASSFYNYHTHLLNKRSLWMNLLMLIVTIASVVVTIITLMSDC